MHILDKKNYKEKKNEQICNFIFSGRRVGNTGHANFFPDQRVGVIYTFYLLFQMKMLTNVFTILISNPWNLRESLRQISKHCH